MTFIIKNWRFFIIAAILLVLAIRGIHIDQRSTSHSYSYANAEADANAFAFVLTDRSMNNLEWNDYIVPVCKINVGPFCWEYNQIDRGYYDKLCSWWIKTMDYYDYTIKCLQKKQKKL